MTLGLGYTEIAIIMVIALIVIGPKKLPQLMRDFGKIMGQLRRASDDLRREVLFSDEINSIKRAVDDATNPLTPPPVPPKLKLKDDGGLEDRDAETDPSPEPPEAAAALPKDQGEGPDEQ